jgi:hypothetical protein
MSQFTMLIIQTSNSRQTTPLSNSTLYVDEFIYFSPDESVERHFKTIMQTQLRVDLFGTFEWFLGTYYDRYQDYGHASVHLSQEAYSHQLISSHNTANATPADTPYRSGHTIENIPKTTLDNLEQYIITAKYQFLFGYLLWLAYTTFPCICVATSLLAQYNKQPSAGHCNAARYVLKYLIDTGDHSIQFIHKTNTTLVNFIDFFPALDATFSDAKWGPQNASVASTSKPPKMINTNYMRSLYGHLTYRSGGPISWSIFREARTSRSSCESEIKSEIKPTNEATRVTQHL